MDDAERLINAVRGLIVALECVGIGAPVQIVLPSDMDRMRFEAVMLAMFRSRLVRDSTVSKTTIMGIEIVGEAP